MLSTNTIYSITFIIFHGRLGRPSAKFSCKWRLALCEAGLRFSSISGIRGYFCLTLNFSIGKPVFAMCPCYSHSGAIGDEADQNPCSWQAGRRHERKEGERASLCLFCVLFHTHRSDALRGHRDWQCSFRKTSSAGKGKGARGARSAFPASFPFLSGKCSPTLPVSPASGLLLYLASHLGDQPGSPALPVIPKLLHLIPGWVSTEPVICDLGIYPPLLWT